MWIRIRDLLTRDPGWKNSDPGSSINIPDQQHWLWIRISWLRIKHSLKVHALSQKSEGKKTFKTFVLILVNSVTSVNGFIMAKVRIRT
jgi:hypothetical protein